MVEGRSSSKSRSSSFFQVLINQDFATKLKLPLLFSRNYGKDLLKKKASLRVSWNRTWEVEVKRDKKHLVFYNGWEKFVNDNRLKLGEFLVFKYGGDSKFKVTIYGTHCCKREADIITSEKDPQLKPVKVETVCTESDSSASDSDGADGTAKESLGGRSKARNVRCNESEAKKFTSNNPYFYAVLSQASATKSMLNLPSDFQAHLNKAKDTVKLETSEKTWTVRLLRHFKGKKWYAAFGRGWGGFIKDNGLKFKDICIIELVNTDDVCNYTFKVHILRY